MKLIPMILILGISIFISLGSAQADEWGPWETPPHKINFKASETNLLEPAIKLFQKYISPVDGARCNMYPTCSAYALQSTRRYGPLLGTFIFVDRLYHESDSVEHQQPIIKHGHIRYYDSLERNTFWWAR